MDNWSQTNFYKYLFLLFVIKKMFFEFVFSFDCLGRLSIKTKHGLKKNLGFMATN